MNEQIIFLLMITLALFCVMATNLRKVIIGLGVFSLIATVCYLMYHAPDVAITEAVIGSALTTILYIIALKKYSSFYVYFSGSEQKKSSDIDMRMEKGDIWAVVKEYCANHELTPQLVYTWDRPETIAIEHVYDLILHNDGNMTTVYGREIDEHYKVLKTLLEERCPQERLLFSSLEEEK